MYQDVKLNMDCDYTVKIKNAQIQRKLERKQMNIRTQTVFRIIREKLKLSALQNTFVF